MPDAGGTVQTVEEDRYRGGQRAKHLALQCPGFRPYSSPSLEGCNRLAYNCGSRAVPRLNEDCGDNWQKDGSGIVSVIKPGCGSDGVPEVFSGLPRSPRSLCPHLGMKKTHAILPKFGRCCDVHRLLAGASRVCLC